jgi:aminoglycoside 3-N-acetyltransferase
VQSSFKSLGPVQGGAGTVIAALERAVGPVGLLLMPSFNLVPKDLRAATWNIRTTPSTVGWITEYFRTMPGTVRSDHYSHSVAARGKNAEAFVGEHLALEGMQSPWDLAPWGRTYGTRSPMIKALAAGGRILMIGVDYHSSTYCHAVEVMYWNERRRVNPAWPFIAYNRVEMGAYWDRAGVLQRGKAGDAESRLYGIREFVDTVLAAIRKMPKQWAGAWPPGLEA